MASTRRDHLVETASHLFYRNGFHATGIDRILAESGVAKMTLYKHFASKEALIEAVLRRRDAEFRAQLEESVARRSRNPRTRLLAVFDALDDWIRSGDFGGCMFVHAAAEYGRPDSPAHAAAAEHKRLILAWLSGLAAKAGARDPDRLAFSLMLLLEGAIVTAHVVGRRDAAGEARRAAEDLVRSALETGRRRARASRPAKT